MLHAAKEATAYRIKPECLQGKCPGLRVATQQQMNSFQDECRNYQAKHIDVSIEPESGGPEKKITLYACGRNKRGLQTLFCGHQFMSKYAKPGYYVLKKGKGFKVCKWLAGQVRYESADLGFKLFVNNKLFDLQKPRYVENSYIVDGKTWKYTKKIQGPVPGTYDKQQGYCTDKAKCGYHHVQCATGRIHVSYRVTDNKGLQPGCGGNLMPPAGYGIGMGGKFVFEKRRSDGYGVDGTCHLTHRVPDWAPTGNYSSPLPSICSNK